jgi:GNAT superfamily N-acetyltransferase
MTDIVVQPLTPERWADFEKLFGPSGAFGGCWCMWPRMRSKDFQGQKNSENKAAMKSVVASDAQPGMLAYVDGEVAGWVALAPREQYEHWENSRKLKALDRPEGLWSVSCFVIGKDYRRRGLMARLLEAAADYARQHGARVLEAYPIEPGGDLKSYKGFTGVASTFRRAGFKHVGGTERDLIMRKELDRGAARRPRRV